MTLPRLYSFVEYSQNHPTVDDLCESLGSVLGAGSGNNKLSLRERENKQSAQSLIDALQGAYGH